MRELEPFEYIDAHGRAISVAPHTAPADFSIRLGQTKYNGVPLADLSYDFKNDPRFDPRFTQRFSELNAVAFLLVTAGYYNANLENANPPWPDVKVVLSDGSTVYVEVAEVIESASARLNGVLTFVNAGIAKVFHNEPELERRIDGHNIGVRAWMTADGEYDSNAILAEFLDFLRTINLDQVPTGEFISFGSNYPWLQAIDAKYYHGLADTSILPSFNTAAHAFSPESLTAQVMPLLRRKRAMSYSGSPLWLALYMSDPLGIPQLSLSSLRRVPLDFSHFSKLFLGDQRSLLVYTVE